MVAGHVGLAGQHARAGGPARSAAPGHTAGRCRCRPRPARPARRPGDVGRAERRAAGRPAERGTAQHRPAGDQRHGQERGEAAATRSWPPGWRADPLGSLVVQLVEQHRGAGRHGPVGRRARRRPGPRRAAAGPRSPPRDARTGARQPPEHRPVPGAGRGELIGDQQPLGHEDDGRVGEARHGHVHASLAVVLRSSVVPIRAAASLSQPGSGCCAATCAMTSAPGPAPTSGSQRSAIGPLAKGSVAVHTRPAATSARAWSASWRWPGLVSRTSHTCRPATAPTGCPNTRVAVSDQVATRPAESRVNVARPARLGSRRRGSLGLPSPETCDSDSTGACTNLDDAATRVYRAKKKRIASSVPN